MRTHCNVCTTFSTARGIRSFFLYLLFLRKNACYKFTITKINCIPFLLIYHVVFIWFLCSHTKFQEYFNWLFTFGHNQYLYEYTSPCDIDMTIYETWLFCRRRLYCIVSCAMLCLVLESYLVQQCVIAHVIPM